MSTYQVIVSNIGMVSETDHENTARKDFNSYVEFSKRNYGRSTGEDVTLLKDGEVIKEFTGSLNKKENNVNTD